MEWVGKILWSANRKFFERLSHSAPASGGWEQCPLAPSLHPEEEGGSSRTAGGQEVACFHPDIHIPDYACGGTASSLLIVAQLPYFTLYHTIFLLKTCDGSYWQSPLLSGFASGSC